MNQKRDVSSEVLSTLRAIIRAMDIHSRHLSKTSGLTGPQLIVIREIGYYGPMTIGELAKRISLSQATVTTIIDRLERKNLAVRVRGSEDKRRVYVDITQEAQKALENHPNVFQESFIRQFESLEDWEQNLILSSIQRIAAMMKTEAIPAGADTAYDVTGGYEYPQE